MAAGYSSRETPTLYQMSLRAICSNLLPIASLNSQSELYQLHSHVILTNNIVNDILRELTEVGVTLHDGIMHMFHSPSSARLSRLDFTNSNCSDETLRWIAAHPVTYLDLTNCQMKMSSAGVKDAMMRLMSSLETLILSVTTEGFLKICSDILETSKHKRDRGDINSDPQQKLINAPNLRHLSLTESHVSVHIRTLDSLLRQFDTLQVLELDGLSGFHESESENRTILPKMIDVISRNLPALVSLTLFDFILLGTPLSSYRKSLSGLTNLRHLDISISYEEDDGEPEIVYPHYQTEDEELRQLVSSLKHLTSLDISGTHLAGLGESDREAQMRTPNSVPVPIHGLRYRQLDFLGVLNCRRNAAFRKGLPAKTVAGEGCIEHILEALQRYQRRFSQICEVMKHLFQKVKANNDCIENKARCLRLVCDIMRFHMDEHKLQISSTAVVYYLMTSIYSPRGTRAVQVDESYIMRTLIQTIQTHTSEPSVQKNILIIMSYLPASVSAPLWSDVCRVLLEIIEMSVAVENQLSRLAIIVLNSLACNIKQEQKREAGDLGVVRTMLWLIKMKVEHTQSDVTLEHAWSVLWNITDETPENCRKFLTGDGEQPGLDLFLECYNAFCLGDESMPDNDDAEAVVSDALLRNIMGLLGNVAEVPPLRNQFLPRRYINIFRQLLGSRRDGIEVSYNAAGIVAHLASDGPHVEWGTEPQSCVTDITGSMLPFADDDDDTEMDAHSGVILEQPMELEVPQDQEVSPDGTILRNDVLLKLEKAIARWPLDSQRTINYRSFKPITRLLMCNHTRAVRHWAIWALSNLTSTVPEKYCPLLVAEKSIPMILELSKNENEVTAIKELAEKVLENCTNFGQGGY